MSRWNPEMVAHVCLSCGKATAARGEVCQQCVRDMKDWHNPNIMNEKRMMEDVGLVYLSATMQFMPEQ